MQSNFWSPKMISPVFNFEKLICFCKNEASSISHYNIFLFQHANTVSFLNAVWFLSFCQCKKSFSSFWMNLGTGIKRNCSTRTALNSSPEILLPSENTLVSFTDTSFAWETEVHCLATKMARVKGGFSVRRGICWGKGRMSLGFCTL